MTIPPTTPRYGMVERGSPAYISPRCFIAQRERAPAREAAKAISSATFSFTEYSNWIPRTDATRAKESVTSLDGVPGYPLAKATPASSAPRTIASSPSRSAAWPSTSCSRGSTGLPAGLWCWRIARAGSGLLLHPELPQGAGGSPRKRFERLDPELGAEAAVDVVHDGPEPEVTSAAVLLQQLLSLVPAEPGAGQVTH